jgi:hypothetical protein
MKYIFILFLIASTANSQAYFKLATTNIPNVALVNNTMDVATADFNQDGFLDIVVAKEFQRNRILYNNGNGVFSDATSGKLSNVSRDSEDIAIADLNNDGLPDLVFASEDDETHEMYLNTNIGNFIDVSNRLPKFTSNAVVSSDLNKDGKKDLIFGNNGQEKIFINTGDANFVDETNLRLPIDNDITQDVLLVDVDNDGDEDLLIGNEGPSKLLINDGDGYFTDESLLRLPQGVNMETRKIAKGDINNDGSFDLFFCNMASVQGRDVRDRLYLNNGFGFFTDVTNINIPFVLKNTFDASFVDINSDGHTDLLVAYFGGLVPGAFINNRNGILVDSTSRYFPSTSAGNHIALLTADFNGDNKLDVYLGAFMQADIFLLGKPNTNSTSEKNIDLQEFNVFPNPCQTEINLNFASLEETDLKIMNLEGKIISSLKPGSIKNLTIPLNDIPDNEYILVAQRGARILSKKFQKFSPKG